MKLLEELKRIVERFNAEGIDYALCGGLAMAGYAMPRATLDSVSYHPEDCPP